MTDRMPDFEDIEFDELEPVATGTAEPAPAPTAAASAAPAAAAPAAKAEPQAAAAAAPKGLLFALLGVSGVSLAATAAMAVAAFTAPDPVAEIDPATRATIARIESTLAGQQRRLDALTRAAARPAHVAPAAPLAASPAPQPIPTDQLDALASAIHANQKVLESLPVAVAAQLEGRLARIESAQRPRFAVAPVRRTQPRAVRPQREAPQRTRPAEVAVKQVPAAAKPVIDEEIRYP
jgi:hypothetical protein